MHDIDIINWYVGETGPQGLTGPKGDIGPIGLTGEQVRIFKLKL